MGGRLTWGGHIFFDQNENTVFLFRENSLYWPHQPLNHTESHMQNEYVEKIMKIASRRDDHETRMNEIDEILHEIHNHAWNEGYFEGKDSVINRIKETIEEIE